MQDKQTKTADKTFIFRENWANIVDMINPSDRLAFFEELLRRAFNRDTDEQELPKNVERLLNDILDSIADDRRKYEGRVSKKQNSTRDKNESSRTHARVGNTNSNYSTNDENHFLCAASAAAQGREKKGAYAPRPRTAAEVTTEEKDKEKQRLHSENSEKLVAMKKKAVMVARWWNVYHSWYVDEYHCTHDETLPLTPHTDPQKISTVLAERINVLLDRYGEDGVREIIKKAFASKFLITKASNAPVTFSWVMNEVNAEKIIEGAYDRCKEEDE